MKTALIYPVPSEWTPKAWAQRLRAKASDVEREIKRWAQPNCKEARREVADELWANADAIKAELQEKGDVPDG